MTADQRIAEIEAKMKLSRWMTGCETDLRGDVEFLLSVIAELKKLRAAMPSPADGQATSKR